MCISRREYTTSPAARALSPKSSSPGDVGRLLPSPSPRRPLQFSAPRPASFHYPSSSDTPINLSPLPSVPLGLPLLWFKSLLGGCPFLAQGGGQPDTGEVGVRWSRGRANRARLPLAFSLGIVGFESLKVLLASFEIEKTTTTTTTKTKTKLPFKCM